MSGSIFVLHGEGKLVEVREQAYDSEALLQELLAKYPNLLAGDQINISAPRRWLLVAREMGVPSEEDGADRWSVDHLFLDQDAVPTIVEVKRSTDTRIRREVVGQMLDYAANGVAYWPVEEIRSRFENRCEAIGQDPEQVLTEFLGSDVSSESFWKNAKTNLQAGRVRLVFVADDIPQELRRIVEFLNSHMDPTEVLAVEIRQYVGGQLKTLVPRVFGQTAEAQQKKSGGGRETRQWDEESFFTALRARGANLESGARAILEWGRSRDLRISWGKGLQDGSFLPILDRGGMKHFLVSVWTYGRVEVQFELMQSRPPFDDEAKRRELLRRLNEIPGITIPDNAVTKRPRISLEQLGDEKVLTPFLAALDWALAQMRAT